MGDAAGTEGWSPTNRCAALTLVPARFQIVLNFMLMPMFFLSGSLFPLRSVPDWMAALSRIDPVTYGMDPLRRIALGESLPGPFVEQLGVTLFDRVLPVGLELVILVVFGLVMLGLGAASFRRRE